MANKKQLKKGFRKDRLKMARWADILHSFMIKKIHVLFSKKFFQIQAQIIMKKKYIKMDKFKLWIISRKDNNKKV